MSDLLTAVTGIEDASDEHVRSEQYYEGNQPEVFASIKLRRALSKTGTSFRLNFARTPVTSVLDRLQITSVTSPDKRANDLLQDILAYNEFDEESDETHRWSLAYGEGYVIAWPNEDETNVDLFFNSPKTTRIFYDEENPRRKKFAAKVWFEGKKDQQRTRVNLYYADRIEKYISNKKNPKTDSDFVPYVEMWEEFELEDGSTELLEVWPLENPYGEVPVFHLRTQRPYGRPEHRDAFSPQDMVNKLVITQMASNDYHGFPQRYVLAGNTTSDDFDDFDTETEEGTPDQSEGLTSGPGELWWLQGEGLEVGQFDAADADAFLKPLETYVRAMAALTQTPVHHFEGMGDAPSGESLRAAEAPLIKKVKDRQQTFGGAWQQAFKFALKILGITDADVTVTWAPPESHDDKDTWEVVKAKQEAGVSRKRALMEAGYTEDETEEFEEEVEEETDPVTEVVA